MKNIQTAAVIGSGVMGKGIAAHLANCGIKTLLLDIDQKFVDKALADLPKSKPALLYDVDDMRLIRGGTVDACLPMLAECDWIVEVIVEQLEPKQALYAKLEKIHKPGQIISSNTSGIAWSRLMDGRSQQFREHFCITHFFNPVRYLKLVELVGGTDTDKNILTTMHAFLHNQLGKGVVWAKDTPNFVANRIGVHGMMVVLHAMKKNGWTVEAVDKVMGPATGRPKSAIFRTADLVGLDTMIHVARTAYEQCPTDEARDIFSTPDFLQAMVEQKLLGEKTGAGFYKKAKNADGKSEIHAVDVNTLTYRAQTKFKAPSLGLAKDLEDPAERLRAVVLADDDAGKIAWPLISENIVYAANRIPEIADDIVNIDRAMMWGFGWELGPFATWDALGVKTVAERLRKEGRKVPAIVETLLASGKTTFYAAAKGTPQYFDLATKNYTTVPGAESQINLTLLKSPTTTVASNESASLIDLGDGVLCCEFHSKMNAIDADIIAMINEGITRTEKEGVGLVIGNDGANFCVGANIMLIFLEAQQQNWTKIEEIVREFQNVTQRMRFAKKPVVTAPFGMTFGGGCELVLAPPHVVAAAETYTGLVELGVGLIPAGGGCKNMLLRGEALAAAARGPRDQIWMSPRDGGPFPKVQKAFEAIGFAKVSTSAKEAQKIGYLRATDTIVLDNDRLLATAKADAIRLSKNFTPLTPREDISLPGAGGYNALLNAIEQARMQGVVTPYDEVLVKKLAHVLTGGNHPAPWLASEQDILDLEREAFLALCGDERTHARIQSMLMTGKPLRN